MKRANATPLLFLQKLLFGNQQVRLSERPINEA